MEPARKQKVLRLQPGVFDPCLQGVTGGLGNLELHRSLRLVLHDDGACRHLVAVADVPDLESDEVASAQLAVDAEG